MKFLQSSILRAVCAIVFGYMLVIYRNELLHWTTILFGALFFVSGLFSVISYFLEKRRLANVSERLTVMSEMRGEGMATPSDYDIKSSLAPAFPIVGLGSMILGISLAVMPTNFAEGLMYVIAGLLVFGALNLMFNLFLARRFASIGFGFWIVPLLLLVLGVLMLAKPTLFATMPFRILGWGLIVYGVVELINSFKINHCRKQYERIEAAQMAASSAEAEDAVIIEDGNSSSEFSPREDSQNVRNSENEGLNIKL